jgi:hypothetical protein
VTPSTEQFDDLLTNSDPRRNIHRSSQQQTNDNNDLVFQQAQWLVVYDAKVRRLKKGESVVTSV